jgi:hypothetical protein
MSKSLLYLPDIISGQSKTYEFTPIYDDKQKVKGVTVSVFDGRLSLREVERAEVLGCFSLDREAWAVLMSYVRIAFEAKKA